MVTESLKALAINYFNSAMKFNHLTKHLFHSTVCLRRIVILESIPAPPHWQIDNVSAALIFLDNKTFIQQ
jgi:hypothetical protein